MTCGGGCTFRRVFKITITINRAQHIGLAILCRSRRLRHPHTPHSQCKTLQYIMHVRCNNNICDARRAMAGTSALERTPNIEQMYECLIRCRPLALL